MRQQSKPFIVERKPSRKPKPDAQKPSIWGRLDADIAQGLKDQRDTDQPAATGGDDRLQVVNFRPLPSLPPPAAVNAGS